MKQQQYNFLEILNKFNTLSISQINKTLSQNKPKIAKMDANGVNYYKGVLLCSRPNQSPSVERQKPFCGRVNYQQQLGLVPTKQYSEHRTKKRQLPVLNNHKKWLQKFKKEIQDKKIHDQEEQKKKQQHLEKLRQQGRQKIKQVTSGTSQVWAKTKPIQESPQKSNKQPAPQQKQSNPHKKKPKPAWAHTQQQVEQNQQKDIDELLDFFQKGQTQEVKDYVNDENVKKILLELKNKIQGLKEQGNEWKNKEMIRIEDENQRQAENQRRHQDGKDDILSRISKQSGSQSVSSQKTVQRVEQLQKKKETKEWDKMTTSSKKSLAGVDQQIAKHIADEILRNYPNLKHHSNHSIRKLLQKQARQELKA